MLSGVEDPRITWIAVLGLYVMTFVAFGPPGPRPAIALSEDLIAWRRLAHRCVRSVTSATAPAGVAMTRPGGRSLSHASTPA